MCLERKLDTTETKGLCQAKQLSHSVGKGKNKTASFPACHVEGLQVHAKKKKGSTKQQQEKKPHHTKPHTNHNKKKQKSRTINKLRAEAFLTGPVKSFLDFLLALG